LNAECVWDIVEEQQDEQAGTHY